jgi:hypothetical protein
VRKICSQRLTTPRRELLVTVQECAIAAVTPTAKTLAKKYICRTYANFMSPAESLVEAGDSNPRAHLEVRTEMERVIGAMSKIGDAVKILKAGVGNPRFLLFVKGRRESHSTELPAKSSPWSEAIVLILLFSGALIIATVICAWFLRRH